VTGVTGSHANGYSSNSQVRAININGVVLNYLPSGFDNYFTNILGLEIVYTPLKEITKNDLKQFPKIQYFTIYDTQIEYLEKDLFMHNPEITTIRIERNSKLINIHPEMTLPLKKLSTTPFESKQAACTAIKTCYELFWLKTQNNYHSLTEAQKTERRSDDMLLLISELTRKSEMLEKMLKNQMISKKRMEIDLTCMKVETRECISKSFERFRFGSGTKLRTEISIAIENEIQTKS